MEIRFSNNEDAMFFTDALVAAKPVEIAGLRKTFDGRTIRFRLVKADQADHDRVIRALLTLDPDATVRTARAVYEGLTDFEAQYKARNGGEK